MILGLYAGLAALALIIGIARDDADIYRFGAHSAPWKLLVSPFVGVAVGLLIVFLSRLSVHRFDWARRLHRDFRGLLGSLTARDIFILALTSSVGEELLFRGALQPWIGMVPSTIVFAMLHIGPGIRFLAWTFSAFAIGLLFAFLHHLLGDLGAPIVAHFVINFMNLNYIVSTDLPTDE